MGIPSGRVFASTVAIAGALATAAGVLLGSFYLLRPSGGLDPMMTAIVVVVFGGLGSIPGTIVAAYIIGFLQAGVSVFLGVKWASPALFAFMILVLIVRPYGLYGRPEDVRV
jgi:branched-chain amino acid transport system permease protein